MRRSALLCLTALSCLTAASALSACAGDGGDYPSLRPRAFESPGGAVPLAPPLPAPPARPQIVAQASALAARAEDGHRAFTRELAATRAVVARAGAADSESWIAAHEQLSALDITREPTLSAMAELDALNLGGVDAAGLKFGDNDFAAIRAAADRVHALVQAQQTTIEALASSLANP